MTQFNVFRRNADNMRALEIMLLAAVASAAQQQPRPRWSYDTNNRRNGPGSWPGICDQHRSSKQSPIDISLTGHEVRRVRPFLMDGFEDAAETVIDTNDTTVKVTLAPREKKRRVQMKPVKTCICINCWLFYVSSLAATWLDSTSSASSTSTGATKTPSGLST